MPRPEFRTKSLMFAYWTTVRSRSDGYDAMIWSTTSQMSAADGRDAAEQAHHDGEPLRHVVPLQPVRDRDEERRDDDADQERDEDLAEDRDQPDEERRSTPDDDEDRHDHAPAMRMPTGTDSSTTGSGCVLPCLDHGVGCAVVFCPCHPRLYHGSGVGCQMRHTRPASTSAGFGSGRAHAQVHALRRRGPPRRTRRAGVRTTARRHAVSTRVAERRVRPARAAADRLRERLRAQPLPAAVRSPRGLRPSAPRPADAAQTLGPVHRVLGARGRVHPARRPAAVPLEDGRATGSATPARPASTASSRTAAVRRELHALLARRGTDARQRRRARVERAPRSVVGMERRQARARADVPVGRRRQCRASRVSSASTPCPTRCCRPGSSRRPPPRAGRGPRTRRAAPPGPSASAPVPTSPTTTGCARTTPPPRSPTCRTPACSCPCGSRAGGERGLDARRRPGPPARCRRRRRAQPLRPRRVVPPTGRADVRLPLPDRDLHAGAEAGVRLLRAAGAAGRRARRAAST